ncbi:hypothetical protein QVD17_39094 [Tagetes erecta]|uniref:AAA+ ATPase domain-containing protein n=1 Tax=Tagetes erecta TaxID=13708 RepID=A0AAD8NGS7_TARER|nr:hypothetical protein QVD17_39094 [Tagetes erecta]
MHQQLLGRGLIQNKSIAGWVKKLQHFKGLCWAKVSGLNIVSQKRWINLCLCHCHTLLVPYLNIPTSSVLEKKAQEIEEHNKKLKLHTVAYYSWDSVVLNHPATFETLAMDDDKKDLILEDLKLFVRRKDYYKRVGRAWKRGYLLYGPPGTGKSSFIAAMANYLKFDVYDLDLKEVRDNSVLRTLLIRTKNRSIVVIEDIDCNVGLHRREAKNKGVDIDKITLSGLLNLIDGLWSSCGDERIIIFTTNHKEVLDPALLRPGRMDVHVEMSYCTYDGFKTLASTYLQVEEDEKLSTFQAVKKVLKKTKVTPAEIAGELMKGEDVDVVLENLIQWLRMKHETK